MGEIQPAGVLRHRLVNLALIPGRRISTRRGGHGGVIQALDVRGRADMAFMTDATDPLARSYLVRPRRHRSNWQGPGVGLEFRDQVLAAGINQDRTIIRVRGSRTSSPNCAISCPVL